MAEKILETALNSLSDAVFILDDKRHVLFVNIAGKNLFGKNFIGSNFIQIIRQPDCINAIDEVLAGSDKMQATITVEHPDKAIFRLIVADLGNDNEGGEKVLVSLSDITGLRDVQLMRSDFVANVSHELRSPLTALSGFIETIKGPASDDETARGRFLNLMESEARRMTRLIADLLSLSKVESNLRVRPDDEVDLTAILNSVKSSLAEQARNESKRVEIIIGEGVGPVRGSEDELFQVFQNLVENALKYGSANSIVTIRAQIQYNVSGIQAPSIAVEVQDRGEGIAKQHIGRLTERFYRVDTHRSRDKGGTGLGLAIAKHIINRHRGRLAISSKSGVGSTFTVYLPANR